MKEMATVAYPPDDFILSSLHLGEFHTWVTLGIIWVGFVVGFIQAWLIYYLLTRKGYPRGCDRKSHPNPSEIRKRPHRLCFFHWGMTQKDYEAYFWDPKGYGRRRYEEQEKHTIHRILLRWFRRSLKLKESSKAEIQEPEAAATDLALYTRPDYPPSRLRLIDSTNELTRSNTNPTDSVSSTLKECYQLPQFHFETTRRRNVTDHRALAWDTRSQISIQGAASTAREWNPNSTDYFDALDDIEKPSEYACQSTEGTDGASWRRVYTAPIPATHPKIEKITRFASEGSHLAKTQCAEVLGLVPAVNVFNANHLEDYEAQESIDGEISSRGSSTRTMTLQLTGAENMRATEKDGSELSRAAKGASRISYVPQLTSAPIIIPKTRSPAARATKSPGEPVLIEKHSCIDDKCSSASSSRGCSAFRTHASICALYLLELTDAASMTPHSPHIRTEAYRELDKLRTKDLKSMHVYKKFVAMSAEEQERVYDIFKKGLEGRGHVRLDAEEMRRRTDVILGGVRILA